MPDPSIYCFISYSRRDATVAHWLQKNLESYKYSATQVTPERRPSDPARLRPVFLDTNDLRISSGTFWDEIRAKLDVSRYLLVLCSQASASSEYVNREIARFIGENEGRVENIILAIVDPQIRLSSPTSADFPPEILQRWRHFGSRNLPQVRAEPGQPINVARERCLMQIISFMLGIEWTVLYNRHLIERRKVIVQSATLALFVLIALSAALSWAWLSTQKALQNQRELTTFESKVFPHSLVVGYVRNFLSPLLTSLEKEPAKPIMIIVLPNTYEELDQNKRVAEYQAPIKEAGYDIKLTNVATSLPRGAVTGLIVPTPPYYQGKQEQVYIDFASTVTAFHDVIDYKKQNPFYAQVTQDEMLNQYDEEFADDVKATLKKSGHQDLVIFVRTPAAALQALAGGK